MFLCFDVMVMSTASSMSFPGDCGVGMSGVYMYNNVGDMMPRCGTPVLNWR